MAIEPKRFRNYYKTDGNDSVESTYATIDNIKTKFIVRDESARVYLVFDGVQHYIDWFEKQPVASRMYHEVICGSQPQKIKVDIDIKHDQLMKYGLVPVEILDPNAPADNLALNDTPVTKAQRILETVVNTLKKTFYMVYFIDNVDVVVCDSSGPDGDHTKFSYHLIVPKYCLVNHLECKMFAGILNNHLDDSVKPFIDPQVNKSLQNFRLFGCHKGGPTPRIKRVPDNIDPLDTIITNISQCTQLHPIINIHNTITTIAALSPAQAISDDDGGKVLNAISQHIVGHKLRIRKGNMFIFDRTSPTHCTLCDRIHHSDHTMYITVVDDAGILKVFEHCRHNLDKHSRLLTELISSDVSGKSGGIANTSNQPQLNVIPEIIKRRTAEARLAVSIGRNSNVEDPSLFDGLDGEYKNVYDEPSLRPFELKDTLCVKANMKMGKTKALKEYLNTHFTSTLRQPIIRILSFRQTFSSNIKEKFPDFTLYSDVKGALSQPKLIIQVESLHRLDTNDADHPDLLVMDECESIFEQFDSGLLRSFSMAWATFEWLLRYSKHVIVMDANLGDRTYRLLKKIRIDFYNDKLTSTGTIGDSSTVLNTLNTLNTLTPRHIFYHHDKYKNASRDVYRMTSDKPKWYWALKESIASGSKIAIPSSSLTEAELAAGFIEDKFPHVKVGVYSSKTSATQKREHFNNVHEYWSQYDVLIYTPTVTAGISYEQVHFDKVFAYFTDRACNAETCQQMLGRVRNVSNNEYTVCIGCTKNNLPVDIGSIKQSVNDRRLNLFREFDNTMLNVELDESGKIKCHESNYYHLWLENMRIRNLSINDFGARFIKIITQTGATMKILNVDAPEEDLVDIFEDRKLRLAANKQKAIEMVANAVELDDDQLRRLEAKQHAEESLTPEEESSYRKYKLRRDYQWTDDITESFVISYDNAHARKVYRRLSRILSCGSVDESLATIKRDEASNYEATMNADEKDQYADLKRSYVYDIHRVAIGFIKLCGWTPLFDRRCVPREVLADAIERNIDVVYSSLVSVQSEFDIRNLRKVDLGRMPGQPPELYLSRVLKHINKVLDSMYDMNIKPDPTDKTMYLLVYGGLFAMEPTYGVPCIAK